MLSMIGLIRIVKFYTRLTSKAKPKKLAVIASMRKLILMAFSIFKSEQNHEPLIIQNQFNKY